MSAVIRALMVLIAVTLIAACSDKPAPESRSEDTHRPSDRYQSDANNDERPALLHQRIDATVAASCERTDRLFSAVTGFLDAPSRDTLMQARESWADAHLAFRRVAMLYRLAEQRQPQMFGQRDPVDATPMLPGYLDRVPGYPNSGLVYSEVPLTSDFLRKEHQSTDFYYLTQGFHPLESLLWPPRQHGSGDAHTSDRTPGADRVAAFVPPEATPENQINVTDRRRDLLRLIAGQLQRDMRSLCKPETSAYLLDALEDLQDQREPVLTRLKGTLKKTTGKALQDWAAHPDGEDHNGMPVAHSPRALGDFRELAALTSDLREHWLPLLLDDIEGEAEPVSDSLRELASTLGAINLRARPVSDDLLKRARQQLTKVTDLIAASL